MNAAGILLDSGPIVALLSRADRNHSRAVKTFSECLPPFRTCEAVVAEACFLMKKIHATGPAEVIALARKGLFQVAVSLQDQWVEIEVLLKKYADRPISLADASLIRCAELHEEPRVLTFDADFAVYRWGRNRKFDPLSG